MDPVTLTVAAALAAGSGLFSDTVRAVISSVFKKPNKTSVLVRAKDGEYQSVELDRRDSGLTNEELAKIIAKVFSETDAQAKDGGQGGSSVT